MGKRSESSSDNIRFLNMLIISKMKDKNVWEEGAICEKCAVFGRWIEGGGGALLIIKRSHETNFIFYFSWLRRISALSEVQILKAVKVGHRLPSNIKSQLCFNVKENMGTNLWAWTWLVSGEVRKFPWWPESQVLKKFHWNLLWLRVWAEVEVYQSILIS